MVEDRVDSISIATLSSITFTGNAHDQEKIWKASFFVHLPTTYKMSKKVMNEDWYAMEVVVTPMTTTCLRIVGACNYHLLSKGSC